MLINIHDKQGPATLIILVNTQTIYSFCTTGERLLLTSPSSLYHSSSPATHPNSIKALFDHLEGSNPYHPLFDQVTTDAVSHKAWFAHVNTLNKLLNQD